MNQSKNENRAKQRIYLLLGVGVVLIALAYQFRSKPIERVSQEDVELPPLQLQEELRGADRRSRKVPAETPDSEILEEAQEVVPEKRGPSDTARLKAITSQWVYRGYAELPDGKSGEFHALPGKEPFLMALGQTREGVKITGLDRNAAVATLGDATLALPMISEEMLKVAGKRNPNPEEAAIQDLIHYQYYEKRMRELGREYFADSGSRFPRPNAQRQADAEKEFMETFYKEGMKQAENYQPRPGEIMPQQPSSDFERELLMENYFRSQVGMPPATPQIPEAIPEPTP